MNFPSVLHPATYVGICYIQTCRMSINFEKFSRWYHSTWKFVLDFKAIDRMKTCKVWSRCFVLLIFWNYYFDPVWSVIGFVLLLVSHYREQHQSCIYRKLWLTASSRTPTELLWKGKLEVVLTNLLKKRYFSLTWRKTLFVCFSYYTQFRSTL